MKLSPRNQLILVAAAVVVIFVVLVVLVVMPQFRRLSDMEARINEADARADQAQALLARRQEAKANAAGTDASLLELAAAVPENPDLPSLLIELQDLAYDYNVVLFSVRPEELDQPGTGYLSLPIEIVVRGAWADTVEFTQALMTLSRQLRVVSSSSEVLDEGDLDKGVVTLDPYSVSSVVKVETYLIPAASTTTTVPGAPVAPVSP